MMENIFLMQHSGYINGHILIDKDGEIIYNEDEYEILNFIFSNKIQDFSPIIIEYELFNETIGDETMNSLITIVKHYVNDYKLNPFLNVTTMKEIFDCNIPDYFFDNREKFKELKLNLVNKDKYLLNKNSSEIIDNVEKDDVESIIINSSLDNKITTEELDKIKDAILKSMNINKIQDQDLANKVIQDSVNNGLLKKHHDSNEVVTMGTLLAILNRMT